MQRNILNLVKSLSLPVLLLLSISNAQGQRLFDYGFEFSTVGTSGMNFLKIGSGSRSAGLAMTGSGLVGQAENLFHNPAGIAFLDGPDLSLSTNNWLAGSVQHSIAMAAPVGGLVVGLSVINFQISEIEETTVFEPLGTGNKISAGDLQVGLSLARRFTDKLGIGGQIKVVQETLAEYKSENVLIDLGATYFMGWQDLRVSFVFQHFGPDMQIVDQTLRMPLVFRVGIAANLIDTDNSKLLLATELSHPIDNLEQLSVAVEYAFMNRVFARTGTSRFIGGDDDVLDVDHRSTNEESIVYGLGFHVTNQLSIDYALTPQGDAMGDVHHFTAAFNF